MNGALRLPSVLTSFFRKNNIYGHLHPIFLTLMYLSATYHHDIGSSSNQISIIVCYTHAYTKPAISLLPEIHLGQPHSAPEPHQCENWRQRVKQHSHAYIHFSRRPIRVVPANRDRHQEQRKQQVPRCAAGEKGKDQLPLHFKSPEESAYRWYFHTLFAFIPPPKARPPNHTLSPPSSI